MIDELKTLLSFTLLIPLVTLAGLYFSIKLRFLQCTHLGKAWRLIMNDRDFDQKSNSFSAVSAVLGGNLGTGNIAGIAVALAAGGPGALFWMWVMATLGAILKFAGTTLAIMYRRKDDKGEWVGGPMYYLRDALKSPTLAFLFCIFTILSALTVGNLVQMNSLALPLTELGIPQWASGVGMAVLVGLVITGGLKRFSSVVSRVVPFMAVFYLGACSVILATHFQAILPALDLILTAAFQPVALASGVAGFTVLEAIKTGFDRGLFATDVGVGLAPIIHSSVESEDSRLKTALTQGLISCISPFIVMLVCTLTGLVLMVTGAWQSGLESTNSCLEAFRLGLHSSYAGNIVTVTLFFFAFTTILTWSFCADKAIEFLFNTKAVRIFQIIFIATIPFGAFAKIHFVWSIADLFMNAMLIINVTGLLFLSPQIIKKFNKQRKKVTLNHLSAVTN